MMGTFHWKNQYFSKKKNGLNFDLIKSFLLLFNYKMPIIDKIYLNGIKHVSELKSNICQNS